MKVELYDEARHWQLYLLDDEFAANSLYGSSRFTSFIAVTLAEPLVVVDLAYTTRLRTACGRCFSRRQVHILASFDRYCRRCKASMNGTQLTAIGEEAISDGIAQKLDEGGLGVLESIVTAQELSSVLLPLRRQLVSSEVNRMFPSKSSKAR